MLSHSSLLNIMLFYMFSHLLHTQLLCLYICTYMGTPPQYLTVACMNACSFSPSNEQTRKNFTPFLLSNFSHCEIAGFMMLPSNEEGGKSGPVATFLPQQC